jgi:hypothetical protein
MDHGASKHGGDTTVNGEAREIQASTNTVNEVLSEQKIPSGRSLLPPRPRTSWGRPSISPAHVVCQTIREKICCDASTGMRRPAKCWLGVGHRAAVRGNSLTIREWETDPTGEGRRLCVPGGARMSIDLSQMLRAAVAELGRERDHLDRQIAAIQTVLHGGALKRRRAGRGRRLIVGRRRRRMGAAARRAVSQRMKAYWAKRRKAAVKERPTTRSRRPATATNPVAKAETTIRANRRKQATKAA